MLTERGRRFLEHYLQLHTRLAPCPVTADDLAPVVRTLEAVYQRHPTAFADARAASLAAEASLSRALVLCAHGALRDKAVIVLGDSDLVSLAIGLLGKTLRVLPQAARILVVETDPSWIDLIRETAQTEGPEIEVLRHNLRDPLPERLHGQFDTFATDPPYTAAGMTLFLSRAIQALRPGGGGHGLFSFAHQSPLELLQIHSNLVRMGLVAREIIPTYGEEQGESQMMLLMTTAATRALVPQQPYEAPIYAGESAPTVRFYVCTRCRARYRVGQQYAFVDAESLKQAGCARCGNTRFRHVNRVVPQGTLGRGALADRGAFPGRDVEIDPAWPGTGQRVAQPEPAPASA